MRVRLTYIWQRGTVEGQRRKGRWPNRGGCRGLVLAMGCYYRLHCLCGSLLCASLRQVADGW